jgi:hypothetical protein
LKPGPPEYEVKYRIRNNAAINTNVSIMSGANTLLLSAA